MAAKKKTKRWEPSLMIRHPDQIQSSPFSGLIPFKPSYEKENEPVNMFYLMANEYSRMWHKERKSNRKMMLAEDNAVFLQRDFVIRGLLKKKKTQQEKKLFKMKRFENIPAKVKVYRCEGSVKTKTEGGQVDAGMDTSGGPTCPVPKPATPH